MDLAEIKWGGVDCIGLTQDWDKWRAVVTALMDLRLQLNSGKQSSGYTTDAQWNSAQLYTVSWLHRDVAFVSADIVSHLQ
jgi:hypothetical protein